MMAAHARAAWPDATLADLCDLHATQPARVAHQRLDGSVATGARDPLT